MTRHRGYRKTIYPDGKIEVSDPLIRWNFPLGLYEIGLRGGYAIGIMFGYRVGTFSRFRTRFLEFKRFTVYVHYGSCVAHNPRTGEVFE